MARFRDYHRKNYTNPFFRAAKGGFSIHGRRSHIRRQSSISWRVKLLLFLMLLIILGVFYFIFYSPYFTIKNIEISGLEKISQEEVKELINGQSASRRFLIFKQNNIFIFNKNLAEEIINSKYALDLLKIDKKLPGDLRIEVREKIPALIWKTEEKYYYLDGFGIAIREIPSEEILPYQEDRSGSKMAVIFDESNASVNIREGVLTRDGVNFIMDLQGKLSMTAGGPSINTLRIANRRDSLIKCQTSEGWEIYLSLINDLNAQIEKLKMFLGEKTQEDRKGLQYVDLRFEDRIYYK